MIETSSSADGLTLASPVVLWESHPTVHDASTVPGRWAALWLGCRSEKRGVRCVKNEMTMHVRLTFQMEEGGKVHSD